MDYSNERSLRIAELNDNYRRQAKQFFAVITPGVMSLPELKRNHLFLLIREDKPIPENNPNGERDFGVVVLDDQNYFWKIDCYDQDGGGPASDPTDFARTKRVLTVMLASEY